MTREEAEQGAWAQILQGPDVLSRLTLSQHYQKYFKNKNELIISPWKKSESIGKGWEWASEKLVEGGLSVKQ